MTRWAVGLLMWMAATTANADANADANANASDHDGYFRSENDTVSEGNKRMAQKDAKGALAAYDEAAKALPNAPGVHLNRGLALMAQGDLDKARTALQLATQPPANKTLRSSAYYNLGNAFFKGADALAGQEQHQEAQKQFREAVDAYKQALRLGPGDANAAWNLQLAARRVREEEEKQEKQDQENQDQQNQDQDQDQDQQDQQKQDQQKQDQQKQDQQKQDQQKQQQEQQQARPSEAERALDALQDGEENLQQYRARQRAHQERRRPEKDW